MTLRDFVYHEEDGITLYHGDCRDVLPLLEPESVDVILADPPYNVGKAYGVHDDAMTPVDYRAWLVEVLALCAKVTRDALLYFPGAKNVFDAADVLALTPLRPVRMLGWHKKEYAGDMWTGGPAMSWEPIVWASKAERPHFNRIFGAWGRDLLVVPSTHGDPLRKLHPCPKPPEVLRWLIGMFVPEDGSLVDPTAGTGTALLAAKDANRRAIGIEIEERYCAIAKRRLAQGVLFSASARTSASEDATLNTLTDAARAGGDA